MVVVVSPSWRVFFKPLAASPSNLLPKPTQETDSPRTLDSALADLGQAASALLTSLTVEPTRRVWRGNEPVAKQSFTPQTMFLTMFVM